MIFVTSTNTIRPGSETAVRAAATACRLETLKETGCLSYDLHHSISDPNVFVFVERWESREALTAHLSTAHLKAWRALAADFVVNRKVEIIHPDRVELLRHSRLATQAKVNGGRKKGCTIDLMMQPF
jgi:quinol monooxygenase YgiN